VIDVPNPGLVEELISKDIWLVNEIAGSEFPECSEGVLETIFVGVDVVKHFRDSA
jgi:hypothetical protein